VSAFAGVRRVTVRSLDGRLVPTQVDGDHIGDEESVDISVSHGALQVVS
jgi:hypothetical protein